MKKLTLTALMTVVVLSLVLTAVKTKPIAALATKDCCKASCPKQQSTEEKKSNSGLIFWDSYSSQLLQIQPVTF
ncbi:MAG: hypothetical protein HYR66_12035 [Sphingobacteriales bacterium]|nr:hypothetical protein [Sphingobacteriales bacterium]MBI3720605.1 hypothetical protein [Sphingobacteriales bacterium]